MLVERRYRIMEALQIVFGPECITSGASPECITSGASPECLADGGHKEALMTTVCPQALICGGDKEALIDPGRSPEAFTMIVGEGLFALQDGGI